MSCSQCMGIEELFDDDLAADELKRYRRRGPRRTSRLLIRGLAALGVEGRTILDIGGGVGAVHLELLAAGARSAMDIDASPAMLRAAYKEAESRGFRERISHRHADFVDVASEVPPADFVTLDRVVCCYDDAKSLLEFSAEHAREALGLVYPRDGWLSRLINWGLNLSRRRWLPGFKTYVHPRDTVEGCILSRGLRPLRRIDRGFWQVAVFTRSKGPL